MKFLGYRRNSGRVGVRNHVLVLPTVICAAGVAERISRAVPGTVYIGHQHGCGHLGDEREHMIRTMVACCWWDLVVRCWARTCWERSCAKPGRG